MNFNFGTPNPATTPAATNPSLSLASGDNKGLTAGQTGAKSPALGQFFGSSPVPGTGGFQLGTSASVAPSVNFSTATSAQNTSLFNQPTPAAKWFSLGSTVAQTSAPSLLAAGLSTSVAPNLTLGPPASATPNFNPGNTTTISSTAGGISSTGLTLGTPATPATTATAAGFSLGKVGLAPSTAISTPSLAPASTGFSLTTTTSASTALTNIATSSSASTVAIPGDSFTFAKLEEALNKWTLELEDQGKMFLNQALQLNAWDRLVIANGEKIMALNSGIEKVKQQQQQLDHELDFVLAQQRELEECIVPLEKELKDVPITDQDRNHTYQMAENLDTQLKQMSENLKEIIEHLNESNKTEDMNDPVAQIGRILNAHMNSLQWIDRNTAQISTFLDQISKMHDVHRRDNERSFHLTYE
ncbi:Nucleoporin 62kD [Carabus blaptoides fortunei]